MTCNVGDVPTHLAPARQPANQQRWPRPTIINIPPICGNKANSISRNIAKSSPLGLSADWVGYCLTG